MLNLEMKKQVKKIRKKNKNRKISKIITIILIMSFVISSFLDSKPVKAYKDVTYRSDDLIISPQSTNSDDNSSLNNSLEEKTVVNIIVSEETPLQFEYGTPISPQSFKLMAKYEDGTYEIVSAEAISTFDANTLGEKEIKIYYKGLEVEYTFTIVPMTPKNIAMTGGNATSMGLKWDQSPQAKKYEIYAATSLEGEFEYKDTALENAYTFEKMTPGKVIYVKVRALADSYYSDYSEALAIAPVPDKVAGIKVEKTLKTSITLSWTATKGATGYAIYWKKNGDLNFNLGGTSTSPNFKVTGLSAGKKYIFVIYAYAANLINTGQGSDPVLFGTAPSIPTIKTIRGGDKLVRVYWKKSTGASKYKVYIKKTADSSYSLKKTIPSSSSLVYSIEGLDLKVNYSIKVVAQWKVSEITSKSQSAVKKATTKKAKDTSTKAKYYKTKKKFKKSKAYKKYKAFKKKVVYNMSIPVPGMINTNAGGFNANRMVPQALAFCGNYLLISAYDYKKVNDSVIYIVDKKTRKYLTSIILPNKGHIGGMAYDGNNIWISYGKSLYSFSANIVKTAVKNKVKFVNVYDFNAKYLSGETISYITYYKGKLWAGEYNELVSKNVYVYNILNKEKNPSLKRISQMLIPNRTQGIVFTKKGKMILSRSCQTKAGRRGFMSRLETYKPSLNYQMVMKLGKKKKKLQLPPMNEGIAINGDYTYVIYESPAFSECQAPVDRITAFKTNKIS